MKKANVTIGGVYAAKVSGKVVPVRIDAVTGRGGWTGTNQATGKQVRIKSARRLRGPWPKKDGKGDAGADTTAAKKAKVDAWRKDIATRTQSDPEERRKQNEKERRAKAVAKRGRKAKPKPKAKRTSILDAAATVLAEADGPMNCKQMVEAVLERGLWQTRGKTPEATLYSALIRHIAKKGGDARFEKVERGMFQLAT